MTPALLDRLFAAPADAEAVEHVRQWWPLHRALAGDWQAPIDRSIAGGFAADRVAWAFGAGYQGALRALDPSLPDAAIACLCVTEANGNAPRNIASTLVPREDGFALSGRKKWSTLGPEGTLLLVAARLPDADAQGRPRIRVARVNAAARGVRIESMPPTRFVPELPHAEVHLDDVAVAASDVLEGDGYLRVVKPFRSIEDIHVNAAVLAYLLREARRLRWPAAWLAEAVQTLVSFHALAGLDPARAATHVALEGVLAAARRLAQAADAHFAARADSAAAARWQRDRSLFGVASAARARRFASACAALGLPEPPAAAAP
ncbi:MAG: acyl-CoA dehydrogenase family protein [Burkholderiales bacterium]|nr:acyl-CoA dehydrogenase family protein [Burkholderiales bacterium]